MIRRRPGASTGRRTWRERLLLLFSGSLACALLLTAGGLAYVYTKYSKLPRVTARLGADARQEDDDAAQNFLLVGVDSAADLAEDDPARAGRGNVGGLRSDTVMVLRVEPDVGARVAPVAAPRPLGAAGERRQPAHQQRHPERRARRAGRHDRAVPGRADPPLHPGRLRRLPGPRRRGRRRRRCTSRRPRATPAPCSTSTPPAASRLDGHQALAYVRSRHFQYYEDGRWRTDPSGDLGRISRQQDFIIRALHRAVAQGARNPLTLDRLVDAGLATVTVDDLLTADDIISLGRAFRSFDPSSLDTYALPTRPGSAGGASILRLQDDEAQPILDRFRGTDAARPAARRRAGAGAQRLRSHRPRRTDQRRAHGRRVRRRRHRRGRALRRHRDASCATRRGTRPRPTWWRATSIPSARLELVEGTLDADVVVVTGTPPHRGPRRAPAARPVDHRQHHDDHGRRPTSTTIASSDELDHVHDRRRLRARGAGGRRLLSPRPSLPGLSARRGTDLPDWLLHGRLPRSPVDGARPGRGGVRDEGDRARRRAGHPPEPREPGHVEAAHARLRQAARLLPDQHAAPRPHQRDPDHLEPRAAAAVRGAARRRPPAGGAGSATPSSPSRTASRRRSSSARTSSAATTSPSCSATTSSTASGLGEQLQQYTNPKGAVVFGLWVPDPERYGVLEFGAGRRGGGRAREAGRPAVELHDPGALLLRQQRRGGGRVDRAQRPRRARDQRGEQPVPGARASSRCASSRSPPSGSTSAPSTPSSTPRPGSPASSAARACSSASPETAAHREGFITSDELRALAAAADQSGDLAKSGYGEHLLRFLEFEEG